MLQLLSGGRGRVVAEGTSKERRRSMPHLETERLILRDFALSDWEAVNAIVSDSAITRDYALCLLG